MTNLIVCINRGYRSNFPSCAGRGSEAVIEAIEAGIRARGLGVSVERIRCFGWCVKGPNIRIEGGAVMHEVSLSDVPAILDGLAADPPTLPPASADDRTGE